MIVYFLFAVIIVWIIGAYIILFLEKPSVPTTSGPNRHKIEHGKHPTLTKPPHKPVPSSLTWPPIQEDGSISRKDGYDSMPYTNITVPKFWDPPAEVDLNTIGDKINGTETIFIMIASYRDFQCRETITSAFSRADDPKRLFIGVVDQVTPGDIGCLDIDIPCVKDPTQPICVYRRQISVLKVDAKYSTGIKGSEN